MSPTIQAIRVLQFNDYFSLPIEIHDEENPYFFGTYEAVYHALEKVNSLPIKAIGEFYEGNPQFYLRWNIDRCKERNFVSCRQL